MEGIHICLWLNHVIVQQKPRHHCKVIIPQSNIFFNMNKAHTLPPYPTPSTTSFTLTLFLGVESIHRRFQERIWLFKTIPHFQAEGGLFSELAPNPM